MDVLSEQIEYYRARAAEYDEWWFRQGRYDRGPEVNAQWFAEVEQVQTALASFEPRGKVLELACGTGNWSRELANYADELTLVDSSPEVLAINAARVAHPNTRRLQADLFSWQPDQQYDVVFFSFWLSHVPPEQFEPFWRTVAAALKSAGRVFLIDSLDDARATSPDQASVRSRRTLNDGREFNIIKIFYTPHSLREHLAPLDWTADLHATPNYFLYGSAIR
jgi:SAM-dependent methyltransferase